MKKFIFLLAVCSTTSFAGDLPSANDSWDTILNNPAVRVFMPGVGLAHEHGGSVFSISAVCVSLDQVRLKSGSV